MKTRMSAKDKIAADVLRIFAEYLDQQNAGNVDSPGGLEHMGDVWSLFWKWNTLLTDEAKVIAERRERSARNPVG